MADIRPYRLTILLHPQSSGAEREAVESLVKNWVGEHKGEVKKLTTADKQKLAYPVAHQSQVTAVHATFSAETENIRDLVHRLSRESRVLRARVFQGEAPSGKHIREIPVKKVDAARKGPVGPVSKEKEVVKEKVPLEKLEEKIEEILEEEVL